MMQRATARAACAARATLTTARWSSSSSSSVLGPLGTVGGTAGAGGAGGGGRITAPATSGSGGAAGPELAAFTAVVKRRWSCHLFKNEPVPQSTLLAAIELALEAPSSFNAQPYRVIIVDEPAQRDKLAQCMLGTNRDRVANAPVNVVFMSDHNPLSRIDDLVALERDKGDKPMTYLRGLTMNLGTFAGGFGCESVQSIKRTVAAIGGTVGTSPGLSSLEAWAYKNTMPAVQTFMLAVTAHGLASCAMEGMDTEKVKAVLGIPRTCGVPVVISVGYPAEVQPPRARFDLKDQVYFNRVLPTNTPKPQAPIAEKIVDPPAQDPKQAPKA